MTLTETQLDTLCTMLQTRRPMGSKTDRKFRQRWLMALPNAWMDAHGNIHVAVGVSRILWSSHTDTVHRHGGRQRLDVDTRTETITVDVRDRGTSSNCLGADDTVGVFLMREMVLAGRTGHYIFHYGEEKGGVGSSALAASSGDVLRESFDYAIALDRAGTSDIITHQYGQRTASTAFALALAGQLPGAWFPVPGVYTDTAEYSDVIPECTNLSVGYGRQHTAEEFVHYGHVADLLQALLNLDESALVVGDKRTEEWEENRKARKDRKVRYLDGHGNIKTLDKDMPWYVRTPDRRPSLVDTIPTTILDDGGREVLDLTEDTDDDGRWKYADDRVGYDGLTADERDYLASVWCDTCDEPLHVCQCDQLSDEDRKFLRYLQGLK